MGAIERAAFGPRPGDPDDAPLSPLWTPIPDSPQERAARSVADVIGYGGQAGGGKAGRCPDRAVPSYNEDMETKVLTPKGFRLIGDIVVGDQVCNPDGTVARVLAIHDRGRLDFYRVTLADGASVEASGDHLWAVSVSGKRKRRRSDIPVVPSGLRSEDEWNLRLAQRCRIMTTGQMAGMVATSVEATGRGDRPFGVLLPLTAPASFTAAPGRWSFLPPYTLGVLVGDGYLADQSVTFTTADQETVDAVRAELGTLYRVASVQADGGGIAYRISGAVGQKKDSPQELLRRDGLLNRHSWDKFIPERIKLSPPDVRFAFIHGLFDSDGSMDDRGHIDFVTVSKQLAKDVQWIVRSLGFKATLSSKTPTFTHKGEKRQGRLAYRLYVRGVHQERLFGMPRKVERARAYNGGDVWPSHRVISVEPTGRDYARCITVDNPNGLYITDDFIVTHNSQFLLGKALTQHRKAIIFRRLYPLLDSLIDESRDLVAGRGRFAGGQYNRWRLHGGRTLEFAACQYEDDKFKFRGRPHDFLGIDEATEFSETQVRFFMGWLRTTVVGQRCQCVMTFNPPTTKEGEWVVRYFAPWVDDKHPNPAADGELRWFLHVDGSDREVAGPGETAEIDGPDGPEIVRPQSRTFFRARLADNPYLMRTDYGRQLMALPEPLRSQLLYGDFAAGLLADPWQIIPTAWVEAAMDRWCESAGRLAQDAVGLDVAHGGSDRTVAAPRHGYWWGRLHKVPGVKTPNGTAAAQEAMTVVEPGSYVNVDAIGYGASGAERLIEDFRVHAYAIDVQERSEYRDRSRRFRCINLRAEMYWRMRDALDPEGPQAGLVMLPPDRELLAELTEHKYELTPQGIRVEKKEAVAARLGRSPDCSDAACLAILPPRYTPQPAQAGGLRPTIEVR